MLQAYNIVLVAALSRNMPMKINLRCLWRSVANQSHYQSLARHIVDVFYASRRLNHSWSITMTTCLWAHRPGKA